MRSFKVGVQLHPQYATFEGLRRGWRAADALGVDSLWLWDHFFPIFGDDLAEGAHLECWTLLSAMAAETEHATVGPLVTSVSYRSPDLIADMARTVDHISGGRGVLGVGAGWFDRDHDEYGFTMGTPAERVRRLEAAVRRVKHRLGRLVPGPVGRCPILIGGTGERRVLKLVAEEADVWNAFVHPDEYARKNRALDEWCDAVGRDRRAVERSVLIPVKRVPVLDEYLAAGAEHVIVQCPSPFDMGPARELLSAASSEPALAAPAR